MRLRLIDYLRLAFNVPLYRWPEKIWRLISEFITATSQHYRDRLFSTYLTDRELSIAGFLPQLINPLRAGELFEWNEGLQRFADEVLVHRFDLLGSGPVQIRQDLAARGVEGFRYSGLQSVAAINLSNRVSSRRLRLACSRDYEPIDWHVDFKSGFRWSASTFYRSITYGALRGVDVKVPWELSRCQHLPPLMLAAFLRELSGDTSHRDSLVLEFRNQVLDFLAHNPPRFGVNWCCSMDIAIRAANWVLAYQIERQLDLPRSSFFEREFERALLAHGRHIVNNLEWSAELTSNHYLANVCGLLFIAVQLPASDETDCWLLIAASELIKETLIQFNEDGSNFEGSTSYHRLSTEMCCFSLALLRGLPSERLNRALENRLAGLRFDGPGPDPRTWVRPDLFVSSIPWKSLANRMAGALRFSRAVTRPDGTVAQIGDNDSGRFFRLSPGLTESDDGQWLMPPENHDHLWAAVGALLNGRGGSRSPDALVVLALSRGKMLDDSEEHAKSHEAEQGDAKSLQSYPHFGLYVYSKARIWCAIRGGSVGQRGRGGHAHNDQLSIDVSIDSIAFFVDPGTYVYTPLPDRRNQLRSTAAHTTIVGCDEQNRWQSDRFGLFSMDSVGKFELLRADEARWSGRYEGYSKCKSERTVVFSERGLSVVDLHTGMFALKFQLAVGCEIEKISSRAVKLRRHGVEIRIIFDSGECVVEEGAFSPRYGELVCAPHLHVHHLRDRVAWDLTLSDSEE